MRKENKVEQEERRIDAASRELQYGKLLYFAKDLQVSSRILAVLSKGVSKQKIVTKVTDKKGKKMVTKTISQNEIERYRIICGSNGKIGTWYNLAVLQKDNTVKINGNVGKALTEKEFISLYPSQCSAFKKIFAEEYNNLIKDK